MVRIEQLAELAISGDTLQLRSRLQDFLAQPVQLSQCPMPDVTDPVLMAVAAGMIELLALRSGQTPPEWIGQGHRLAAPVYLLKSAARMKRLRELCEHESPPPLMRRNVFAPPNYLESV